MELVEQFLGWWGFPKIMERAYHRYPCLTGFLNDFVQKFEVAEFDVNQGGVA